MTAISKAIDLYLSGKTVEEARSVTNPPITTYMFYKELEVRGIEQRGKVSRREVIPDNATLTCLCCGIEQNVSAFSRHSSTRTGYDPSRCLTCKISKNKWEKIPIEKKIFNRTKARALNRNIEFDLTLEDIVLPENCPVFGTPFIYGDHKHTYSIDRKDSTKGYLHDNIAIISNKANMMKSIATTEEVRQLYEWMLSNGCP